jgi:hypothetical protein
MIINVSLNGNKLFDWEGSAEEVAKLDEGVRELARDNDVTPEQLGVSAVHYVLKRGGLLPEAETTGEMQILVWQMLSQSTGNPELPGFFRDYIAEFDFDFDISRADQQCLCIDVEARAQGGDEQSWLN